MIDSGHNSRWLIGIAAIWGALYPPPAAAQTKRAVAKQGPGQSALVVGADKSGVLRAKLCPSDTCSLDDGESLRVPAKAALAGADMTKASIVKDRQVVVVTVPEGNKLSGEPGEPKWQVVVAARPGANKPEIVFSERTGLVTGQPGERKGPMLLIERLSSGNYVILKGEQREDISLCGRPAILGPQLLNPATLTFKPAKNVQRLSAKERASAPRLVAQQLPQPEVSAKSNLRAIVATSAVGNPAALTDGNPETAWAENTGGPGTGEFVLFQVPQGMPVSGFDVVVRPPTAVVADGSAPREFWLAANKLLFHVTMPHDAWQQPGAKYRVTLEKPISTECLALVLDTPFSIGKNPRVALAEIEAMSALANANPAELVKQLKGGGGGAQAPKSQLVAMGEKAYPAIEAGYDALDEKGKELALDVLDQAPCGTAIGVYVRALVLGSSALVKKARGRLLRCADKVGLALAQQLGKAKPSEQAPLSDVLAEAAPKDAVNAIVPLLDVGSAERRRPLRVALAKASRRARAQTEVRRLLIDTSVPPLAALDLLRALGPRAPDFAPESARAFERFARVGDFRTRYLLLEPAAALAPKLPAARTYLGRAISADADPNIRAQAARLVPQPAPFRTELLRALEDSSVRVREAAVVSLRSDGNFAKQALLQRLSEDPWPLVRSATAETMARLAPDPEVDRALCEAVDDESPSVRAPVMRAVGARAVTSCAEPIRAAVEDQEQAPDVRIAAVEALGLMCDSASLDLLTSYARRAADQMLVSGMREMAFEAIEALGRIHPPDLALRLAPLRAPKVPPAVRGAADRALASPIQCGRARRAAPVPAS